MAPQITFYNSESNYRLRQVGKVRQWITECIQREGYSAGEISFIFCSGPVHLDINIKYLGHDYRTDVITFDYSGDGRLSGEIYIDPETVRDNARRYGQTARREMLRVLIHGVLHLCGYKDKTDEEAAAMRTKEDKCLGFVDFP